MRVGVPRTDRPAPRRNSHAKMPLPRRFMNRGNGAPLVPVGGTRTDMGPPYASCGREARELAGASEDVPEHRLGQDPGEGVLLARVVAAEQDVRADVRLRGVGEARLGPRDLVPASGDGLERGIPADRAEGEDHPELREQLDLPDEVRATGPPFLGRGLV